MTEVAIEDYMLTCVSKKYLGLDCLGCGAQRATAFLFKGEFLAALKMYPAIFPILLLILLLGLQLFIKIKYYEKIKIILVVLSIILIVGNYLFKYVL